MLRALIVDDEGIERRGIAMLIERLMLPFEVVDADDGETALTLLRKERFDLLLTDIRMPFMDGLTLAHEARKLYPELYIIIFSAYADFSTAQRAMQDSVCRYLLKPVNVLEFNAVMREVAEKIQKDREALSRQSRLEQEILRYREREAASQANWFQRNREEAGESAPETDGAPEGAQKSVSQAVNLALEIIRREYAQELTLGDVAKRVYLTSSYLSSIFRRETGKSFIRYLNNYRLDRAEELLRTTNRPVGDIASGVGFAGQSYFIMLFRERYGCTPQQYRTNCGGRRPL